MVNKIVHVISAEVGGLETSPIILEDFPITIPQLGSEQILEFGALSHAISHYPFVRSISFRRTQSSPKAFPPTRRRKFHVDDLAESYSLAEI
jgi:hypothetical protein